MCTEMLICGGDVATYLDKSTSNVEAPSVAPAHGDDCGAAAFYITSDGRYAIPAKYVDLGNLAALDLDRVPKMTIRN